MALSDFIPSVWSARFVDKLEAVRVWGELTNANYQGELASGGNVVKIPVSSTSITVGDYVSGTPITVAPDVANGTTIDLPVDQQKYFRFTVDDIQEFQSAPSLMDDAMRESASSVATVMDNYLKGIFSAGHAGARNTAVDPALANDGFGEALIKAFIDMKADMGLANIPENDRWAVVNPRTIKGLERYFLTKPADGVYVPATADQVVRNGFAGTLLGFSLRVTTNTIEATVGGAAHDRIMAGQGNLNVTMAEQMRELEVDRPSNSFSDLVKGLYVYGAKLVHTDRLYTIDHKQA